MCIKAIFHSRDRGVALLESFGVDVAVVAHLQLPSVVSENFVQRAIHCVDARPHSQSFAMPGFMDPLGELPSSAENSDSDFDEADIPENLRATLHVKQKPAAEVKPITFEDLQKVGYTSAASLTNIKEKQG